MARLIDHRAGQYRAELFEELVGQILPKEFPGAEIFQDFLVGAHEPLPNLAQFLPARRIDFRIKTSTGETILVDAKAPYAQNMRSSVARSLRQLEGLAERFRAGSPVQRVILALATESPTDALPDIESARAFFASQGITLDIWDEGVIRGLVETHLGQRLATLSVEAMTGTLAAVGVPLAPAERQTEGRFAPRAGGPALREGFHKDAIVLMADFCSFSAFVQASGGDYDLVTSVMGRLYRESRRLVMDNGGMLDKFMGDGLLAFWLPSQDEAADIGEKLMACATRLVGMAVKLADEWQEQVDLAVAPAGMRCGAALGEVFFIAEDPRDPTHIHAISEAINIAARLQTAADPNSLVMSNRLRTSYFRSDDTLIECEPDAKNIGRVRAWKKSLT